MANQIKESDVVNLDAILEGFIDGGEAEKAAVIAGLLEDRESINPHRWLLLARQSILAGDMESAKARLEKSIECGGQGSFLYYLLSLTHFSLGDLNSAFKWGNKAIKTSPEIIEGYFHLARVCVAAERIGEAATVLKKVLTSDTFNEEVKLKTSRRLGILLMNAKHYKEAIPHLEKALLLKDAEAGDWKNLGHCKSRLDDSEGALQAFCKAVEMEPASSYLYELGDCLLGLDRNEEAIAVLERGARLEPYNVMINYDLSLAYYNMYRHKEGAAAARRALADDPEMKLQLSNPGLGATGNLGLCLMEQGLFEDALSCFDRNIKAAASNFHNKGLTLFKMHRPEEAANWFRKFLEINPDDIQGLNLLGQALDDAGKHAEAVASLKKAIKLDPKYGTGYYDLGVILAKRKDKRTEAMQCYKKALSLNPDDRTKYWALYSIACLHALAGRKAEALKNFEASLAAGLDDRDHIDADKDLDRLRKDPRFTELMKKYFGEK